VCSRHGNPAATYRKGQFNSRPPVWAYPLVVFGAVIFLVVVLATRKSVSAPRWPFCPACAKQRRTLLSSGLGMVGAAVLFFLLGIVIASNSSDGGAGPLLIFLALLLLIVGAVVAGLGGWSAIAGAQVSRDGQWVVVPRASEVFAHQVGQMHSSARPVAPPPGYPLPAQPQPGYAQPGYAQPGYAQPTQHGAAGTHPPHQPPPGPQG
jgi:hypothetical protein